MARLIDTQSLDLGAHMLTFSGDQALPLALNFIASGECLIAQKMLLKFRRAVAAMGSEVHAEQT